MANCAQTQVAAAARRRDHSRPSSSWAGPARGRRPARARPCHHLCPTRWGRRGWCRGPGRARHARGAVHRAGRGGAPRGAPPPCSKSIPIISAHTLGPGVHVRAWHALKIWCRLVWPISRTVGWGAPVPAAGHATRFHDFSLFPGANSSPPAWLGSAQPTRPRRRAHRASTCQRRLCSSTITCFSTLWMECARGPCAGAVQRPLPCAEIQQPNAIAATHASLQGCTRDRNCLDLSARHTLHWPHWSSWSTRGGAGRTRFRFPHVTHLSS
jgi:hypothetical protein